MNHERVIQVVRGEEFEVGYIYKYIKFALN